MSQDTVDPSTCNHPIIYNEICSECGAFTKPDARYTKTQDLYVLTTNIDSKLEEFLLKRKQLALVLDLDKTLIHSIPIQDESQKDQYIKEDPENADDFFTFSLPETFLVRLRPHVREFLDSISSNYFMHVYTLSRRGYALKILEKIDPDHKYFNQRLRAREDADLEKKSISDFFLAGQHMALVIDDTQEVWRNDDNTIYQGLIQLEPYDYFIDMKKYPKSPHLIDKAAITDDTLLLMSRILNNIHDQYFTEKSESVFKIIQDMKRKVFGDCYIYFCDIWNERDYMLRDFYIQKAEEFNGTVLKSFVPYVTHIVTPNPTAPPVIEAQQYKGIYIVNYIWFLRSIYRYEKQNELNEYYRVKNRNQEVAPLVTDGPKEKPSPPVAEEITTDDFKEMFDMLDNSDDEEDNYSDEDISFLFESQENKEQSNSE